MAFKKNKEVFAVIKKNVIFMQYITPTIRTYFKTGKNICAQDSIYFKTSKNHYRFRIIQNGHDRH